MQTYVNGICGKCEGEKMNINQCSKEYRDYLQSERWRKIQLMVKERDRGCCQICGSKEQRGMQVHHANSLGRFHEENHLNTVILICDRCHTKYHTFMKRRDFLRENMGKRINPLIEKEYREYLRENQSFIDFYFARCYEIGCFD